MANNGMSYKNNRNSFKWKKKLGILFNSLKKWCSGFHVQVHVPLFVRRKKKLKHEVMQCKIDNFVME